MRSLLRLLVLACGLVACGGGEAEQTPPHDCEGYIVEVRTADVDGEALAAELNETVYPGQPGEPGLCVLEFMDRVICGTRCNLDDWTRDEAAAEIERIREYLSASHPELVALTSNPQVLDCACRIYY